ncbi:MULTISPECIES: hypothetical protein [unclassified Kribbella]|uniref:hypothetical protein n=1 Tax=unclassified Kribbella TaxID=2644121 RepID=UPI0030159BE0
MPGSDAPEDTFWLAAAAFAAGAAAEFFTVVWSTAAVTITGGAVLAVAMVLPLLLPSLRRIEVEVPKGGY